MWCLLATYHNIIIESTTIGNMIAQDEVPHALPAAVVETAEAEADGSKNDKDVSPLPPVTPPEVITDVKAADTSHHPSEGAASIDIEREATSSESGSNDISAINNNKSFGASIRAQLIQLIGARNLVAV